MELKYDKNQEKFKVLETNDGFGYEAYFVLYFSINLNHVSNVHRKRKKFKIG